jgi:hypothetical protein
MVYHDLSVLRAKVSIVYHDLSVFRAIQILEKDLSSHALLPLAGQLVAGLVGVDDQEGRGRQPKAILTNKFFG